MQLQSKCLVLLGMMCLLACGDEVNEPILSINLDAELQVGIDEDTGSSSVSDVTTMDAGSFTDSDSSSDVNIDAAINVFDIDLRFPNNNADTSTSLTTSTNPIESGREPQTTTSTSSASRPFPKRLTFYSITIDDQSLTTQACLYISRRIEEPASFELNNGNNPSEIGLVSDDIWFFSNTAMCQHKTQCSENISNQALDITRVSRDGETQTISARVHQQAFENITAAEILSTEQINEFTLSSNTYQITSGRMSISFSPDLNSVFGTINFRGINFESTEESRYRGDFEGQKTRRRNCP